MSTWVIPSTSGASSTTAGVPLALSLAALDRRISVQGHRIDFLRRTLTVSRQVQRENGGGVEIRPPKCGSQRMVYLSDELVRLLARHVECHRPGTDPARWLFEGTPGDPPHQNTVGYWWREAQVSAGITGLKMHDLRHYSPRA